MRSLQLQAALAEFVAQAAVSLHADVLAGREVPFELASRSGRGRGSSPLYCYRPLTGAFISERFSELRRLDAYAPAAGLLEDFDGLERYLVSSGAHDRARRGAHEHAHGRSEAALLAFLQDVFDEQTDFDQSKLDQHPERLERALERLEGSALAAAGEVTLVATLHGLTIASPELALTRGLLIAHPDAIRGAPEHGLFAGAPGEADHLLVVFSAQDSDPRASIAQGSEVVRELLRALRLFGDGRIALGPLAWTRIGSAPWEPIALGGRGRPHGMLVVRAEQEDELRAFCNLVSRRTDRRSIPHSGHTAGSPIGQQANEVAWALRRFELGCERASEYEGLSDHLMALRILLGGPSEQEPDGPPDGLLAGRLAALCATPDLRAALVKRTLKAIALERHFIAGTAVERASGIATARDLSNHLRALLRDVVCGHLPSELASLADELLLGDAEPDEGARAAGGPATPSGEEAPGEDGQPAEVLHVAV